LSPKKCANWRSVRPRRQGDQDADRKFGDRGRKRRQAGERDRHGAGRHRRRRQEISTRIETIATSAREQAVGLQEINVAINEMDQTTQQNAAMVEETNAATQGLSGEAVKLEGLVRRFNTGGNGGRSAPAAANTSSKPAQSPARALGAKIASAFGRGGAATAQKEESWSEF
jgi:hypothetical protein